MVHLYSEAGDKSRRLQSTKHRVAEETLQRVASPQVKREGLT